MARSDSTRAERRQRMLTDVPAIPNKLYFRIGEVSQLTRTKAYVLRYWETEFPTLKPTKTGSGHRLYRRQDVETILEIKRLLYAQGFTIDGARRKLNGQSPKGAKSQDGGPEQKQLFARRPDAADLKTIRRELQAILTMLSRRC